MAEPEKLTSAFLGGRLHAFLSGVGCASEPDPGMLVRAGTLVTVKQVHSARALTVEAPFAADERPEADAMATATPGLVLGIVTADCAPVLLEDYRSRVVGAAHAGWRGALGGVLDAVVDAMVSLGAERAQIRAAIGPTIAQASYEVDAGFRARFLADDPANAALFIDQPLPDALVGGARPDHYWFDLPGYVRQRLYGCGIKGVNDLGIDTYADPARFHSFRRATHRGEPTHGRQYSLIACPG